MRRKLILHILIKTSNLSLMQFLIHHIHPLENLHLLNIYFFIKKKKYFIKPSAICAEIYFWTSTILSENLWRTYGICLSQKSLYPTKLILILISGYSVIIVLIILNSSFLVAFIQLCIEPVQSMMNIRSNVILIYGKINCKSVLKNCNYLVNYWQFFCS